MKDSWSALSAAAVPGSAAAVRPAPAGRANGVGGGRLAQHDDAAGVGVAVAGHEGPADAPLAGGARLAGGHFRQRAFDGGGQAAADRSPVGRAGEAVLGRQAHAEQRPRAGALRLQAPGRAFVETPEHERHGVGLGQHLGQRGLAELGGVAFAHRPGGAEVAQEVAFAVMVRLAAHAPQRAGLAQAQQHALFGDRGMRGELARQRRAGRRTGGRSGKAVGAGQRQGDRRQGGTQRRIQAPAGGAARRWPPGGEQVRGIGLPDPVVGQRQQPGSILGGLAQRRRAPRAHPQRARDGADRTEGGQRQDREHGQLGGHRVCGSHMRPIVRIKGSRSPPRPPGVATCCSAASL